MSKFDRFQPEPIEKIHHPKIESYDDDHRKPFKEDRNSPECQQDFPEWQQDLAEMQAKQGKKVFIQKGLVEIPQDILNKLKEKL